MYTPFLFFVIRCAFCIYLYSNVVSSKAGNYFVLEMLLLTLGLFFIERKWRVVLIPFLIIHVFQYTSLTTTGHWIDSNALQNLDVSQVIGSEIHNVLFTLVSYGLSWIPSVCSSYIVKCNKTIKIFSICISLLFLCLSGSPVRKFHKSVMEAWTVISFKVSNDRSIKDLFLRKKICGSEYKQPLPFSGGGENVILIFAEGTSSKIISEEMMPNTFNFLQNSMSFKNYYNHQAATFRGIRGTLISGFTYRGGLFRRQGFAEISEEQIIETYSNTVESVPSILNAYGYQTVFISPHKKHESLATLMKAVGFDEARSSDKYEGFDTDEKVYERIFNDSVDLSKKGKFFLTAYIVGTHHGLDSSQLKFGDGTNPYKNKFYNQDYWFGKFIEKFKASPLARNTIIIYTSDHTTYPAKEFQETFGIKNSYFHDEIPLAIYGPGIPKGVFNMGIRSSLALAPTILDILNICNYTSHFLGNSLFDQASQWEQYCAQGNDKYFINSDGSVVRTNSKEFSNLLKFFYSISG